MVQRCQVHIFSDRIYMQQLKINYLFSLYREHTYLLKDVKYIFSDRMFPALSLVENSREHFGQRTFDSVPSNSVTNDVCSHSGHVYSAFCKPFNDFINFAATSDPCFR